MGCDIQLEQDGQKMAGSNWKLKCENKKGQWAIIAVQIINKYVALYFCIVYDKLLF